MPSLIVFFFVLFCFSFGRTGRTGPPRGRCCRVPPCSLPRVRGAAPAGYVSHQPPLRLLDSASCQVPLSISFISVLFPSSLFLQNHLCCQCFPLLYSFLLLNSTLLFFPFLYSALLHYTLLYYPLLFPSILSSTLLSFTLLVL